MHEGDPRPLWRGWKVVDVDDKDSKDTKDNVFKPGFTLTSSDVFLFRAEQMTLRVNAVMVNSLEDALGKEAPGSWTQQDWKCFASVLTFKTNVTFMCLPRRQTPYSESHCCPSVTPDLRRGRVGRDEVSDPRRLRLLDFLLFHWLPLSGLFALIFPLWAAFWKLVLVHTPPSLTRVWLSSVCRPLYALSLLFGALYLLWCGPLTYLWNEMC